MNELLEEYEDMPYTLIRPDGVKMKFYIFEMAKMYKNIYGGVIVTGELELLKRAAA